MSRAAVALFVVLAAPSAARGEMRGPVLPAALAPEPSSYFTVGVGLERFGREVSGNDNLIGVAVTWRLRSFGPNLLLMSKPSSAGYEDSRFLAGFGLRGYLPLLGTEFSYGVGIHAETRLEDHYWLAYASPLELGAVVWARDSWNIELFLGVRRAIAGELINHFLIDPNGFDNEVARGELRRLRTDAPWQGFVRVVFARRID